jgi:hypothetical protein
MAAFNPGAFSVTPTIENFLAQASFIKPEIEPEVAKRVQRLHFSDVLMLLGAYAEVPTGNIEYSHKELGQTYPKIKAYNGGAGSAGAPVTYTLSTTSPSQQINITQQAPYTQTVPASYPAGVPVREGDILGIKPSTGYTGAANILQARVISVNVSAGTFVAEPVDSAVSLPSISSGSPQEIIIWGPGSTEAGGTKRSLTPDLVPYANNLTYLQDSMSITNIAANSVLWYQVGGAYKWDAFQQQVRFEDFKTALNNTWLMSEQVSNSALASNYQSDPILQGTGLIPDVLANGQLQNYTTLTGFGVPEFKQLGAKFETENSVTSDFMVIPGYNLASSIYDNMADYFKNGAITYGMFSNDVLKHVNLEFDTIVYAGYNYKITKTKLFTAAQTFGANGYNFSDEGLVLPAGKTLDTLGGGMVPMIRVRKAQGMDLIDIAPRDNKFINGQYSMTVEYRSTSNLEVFGLNNTAYISKV